MMTWAMTQRTLPNPGGCSLRKCCWQWESTCMKALPSILICRTLSWTPSSAEPNCKHLQATEFRFFATALQTFLFTSMIPTDHKDALHFAPALHHVAFPSACKMSAKQQKKASKVSGRLRKAKAKPRAKAKGRAKRRKAKGNAPGNTKGKPKNKSPAQARSLLWGFHTLAMQCAAHVCQPLSSMVSRSPIYAHAYASSCGGDAGGGVWFVVAGGWWLVSRGWWVVCNQRWMASGQWCVVSGQWWVVPFVCLLVRVLVPVVVVVVIVCLCLVSLSCLFVFLFLL